MFCMHTAAVLLALSLQGGITPAAGRTLFRDLPLVSSEWPKLLFDPPGPTNAQRAKVGLGSGAVRPGLTTEALFDLCPPETQRVLGRFTEYGYDIIPGYYDLSLLAVDGRLQRATWWECTGSGTYFDKLTPAERREYDLLRAANRHVPEESVIGRWSRRPRHLWER